MPLSIQLPTPRTATAAPIVCLGDLMWAQRDGALVRSGNACTYYCPNCHRIGTTDFPRRICGRPFVADVPAPAELGEMFGPLPPMRSRW